ncbi:porin [Deltaproteobacteria bacterium TL4]
MLSKTIKSLALIGVTSFFGLSIAQAACMNEKTFCYKADIYAGIYMNTPENADTGYSTTNTYGRSDVKIQGKLAEKDGWKAEGTLKLELNTKGDGQLNKADEVFMTLSSGSFGVIAGLVDLSGGGYNGSDLGKTYATEQGNASEGTYGDEADDAPTLAVFLAPSEGLKLTLGLISGQNKHSYTTAAGTPGSVTLQSQVFDVIATYAVGGLSAAFELENASESDNDIATAAGVSAGDATSAMGLGVQYTAGMFAPFAAYGTKNDGTDTAVDTLLGIDLHNVAGLLGITIAIESRDDGTGGGKAGVNTWSNTTLAVELPLGPGNVTFGLWSTDQLGGDATQFITEFAISI